MVATNLANVRSATARPMRPAIKPAAKISENAPRRLPPTPIRRSDSPRPRIRRYQTNLPDPACEISSPRSRSLAKRLEGNAEQLGAPV